MVDRISQLPDDILRLIISMTDLKSAVRTSLLSTRWKTLWFVWFSLSDLDFNFRRCVKSLDMDRTAEFVDHFFSHRKKSSIRKFVLSVDMVSGDTRAATLVAKCVDYALNNRVPVLHLDGLCDPSLELPEGAGCRAVRELKLTACENRCYIFQWFNRFTRLEKLTLHRCKILRLCLMSWSLRDLEIINDDGEAAVASIYTPLLTSFRYEGSLQYFNIHCPKLDKAHLNIHLRSTNIKHKSTTSNCMEFLLGFRSASIVTLSSDIIKALEADCGAIEQSPSSPFPRMTCLKLIKGEKRRCTVQRRVMDYLTEGCLCGDSLVIHLPEGVSVVEETSQHFCLQIKSMASYLFQIQD